MRDFAREFLAMATALPNQLGPECPNWDSKTCDVNTTGRECVANRCVYSSSWYMRSLPVGSKVVPSGGVVYSGSDKRQLWASARIVATPLRMYKLHSVWHDVLIFAMGAAMF